jgi:AbiV family abortive infection protein
MDVTPAVLLKGAWYALEQCGNLLRDTIVLYRATAYSSAVTLAMFGREELGKHMMLLQQWRAAQETGTLPTVEAIKAAHGDHVDKHRWGLKSLLYTPDSSSTVGKAMETKTKYKPQDEEYQNAEAVIQHALNRLAKQVPDARHSARVRALYVDLNDSGTEWNRPQDFPETESYKLLSESLFDYVIQCEKLKPDRLRNMGDQRLAEALEAWNQRPDLPQPFEDAATLLAENFTPK